MHDDRGAPERDAEAVRGRRAEAHRVALLYDGTLPSIGVSFAVGVRLALDDFGTGYSSLSYLARFPVHAIKIDRTFIHDLRRGGSATGLVDAIIALAHNLRLEVIAEGVEIAEQLAYAADRGVELAQGYHIHPPLHAEDFRALLGGKVPAKRLLRAG